MMLSLLARVLALQLGVFTSLNLITEARYQQFHPNVWWIDLRFLPVGLDWGLLGVTSILLMRFAIKPVMPSWLSKTTIACLLMLTVIAIGNALMFWTLIASNEITSSMPIPFSIGIAFILSFIVWRVIRASLNHKTEALMTPRFMLRSSIGCIVLSTISFPLGLMFCFGQTDYRRPADAIVVFGCKVYPDGEPSLALADRVRTGCELYQAGLARMIVFSGGPGEGAIHETTAMRQMAIDLGIPDSAIAVDLDGLNTWATARNTSPLFDRTQIRRVLAVSHFYHLPRVKLAFQCSGRDVFTVPANESRSLPKLPFLMTREIVAFWAYYLRSLLG